MPCWHDPVDPSRVKMDDSEPPLLVVVSIVMLVAISIAMPAYLYFLASLCGHAAEFCRDECEEYGRALLAGSNVQML